MADKLKKLSTVELASYILAAVTLLVVLYKGLLGALFAGLLVYALIHSMTPFLGRKISDVRARLIAATILGIVVVTLLTAAGWALASLFHGEAGHGRILLQKVAGMLQASRPQFPEWLRSSLPTDADDLAFMLGEWLHEHALEARNIGAEIGRTVAHLLVGMIIGALIAIRDTLPEHHVHPPLIAALRRRIFRLRDSFQNIIFAQVWISAINTVILAVYVLVILPLAGIRLPLTKSLIAVTFFAGLLPVIGNLISNTLLVFVSLSHSLHVAVFSLLFMVVVHKLEYFLNARIVGNRIQARAWELLIAMLAMEAIFGIPGLIAAPVYYAYVKRELSAHGLI